MSHISGPPVERVTIPVLQQWKQEGRRVAMTTAYDAITARIADATVDIILVRDSVGNVCLGFDNTLPVSMAMMNHHQLHAPGLMRCLWPICLFLVFTSARRRRYATPEASCSVVLMP